MSPTNPDKPASRQPGRKAGAGNRGVTLRAQGIMTDEESEWIRAVHDWMRRERCTAPPFTDLLALARYLGYRKVVEVGETPWPAHVSR